MQYYRLTEGTSDKGTLIPATTDLSQVYKTLKPNKDYYLSIFKFNEEHKKRFDEVGSIAGITDVTTNKLVWDFDFTPKKPEDNPELAREEAISLIDRLQTQGYSKENIKVFFSGNKGFEVSMDINEELTPAQAKNVCLNLAEGLNTVDRVIYNATRILRMPCTKHDKSGLFKYPLTVEDIKSTNIQEIKELAKESISYDDIKDYWKPTTLKGKLLLLKDKTPEVKVSQVATSYDLDQLDWSTKPRDLSYSKWLLEMGFFENGERSHALMILASTYKSLGFDDNKAYYLLKSASDKQSLRTGDDKFPKNEIWNNIIKQVYSSTWQGGTYSEKTDELLMRLALLVPPSAATKRDDVLTIKQTSGLFKEFAANIDKNILKFGIKSLDESLMAMIGRVYVIGGSPGSGKSSLGLQILNNTSLQDIPSMFFSFDMGLEDVYQKLIQKHTKKQAKVVFEDSKDPEKCKEFDTTLDKNYANVYFIRSSGMTVEAMKNRIIETERVTGVELKLVLVDYLDLVQADFSDPTQKSMAVIQGLKEIATSLRKCVVVLSQPNKANQKVNKPVESYAAIKGSGAVAELANAVLWIHRPGANPRSFEDDLYYSVDCLKNRHGAMFSLDYAWEGVSGTIAELTPAQRVNLQNLRARLEEDEDEDDNRRGF
jgi:replicative DNA helicase